MGGGQSNNAGNRKPTQKPRYRGRGNSGQEFVGIRDARSGERRERDKPEGKARRPKRSTEKKAPKDTPREASSPHPAPVSQPPQQLDDASPVNSSNNHASGNESQTVTLRPPKEDKPVIAKELAAMSKPTPASPTPSTTRAQNFKGIIKVALELAREQRARVGKFRKDEKHATMELYELLGLENDEFIAPPNELQLALRAYSFPPPMMANLKHQPIDKLTLEEILGPQEAARRIANTSIEVVTKEADPSSTIQLKEKLRRQAVSSEAGQNMGGGWLSRRIEKTPEQVERIEKILQDNILFVSLDSRDRKVLLEALEQEDFKPGDVIINQGEDGDSYYVIDTGRCQITIKEEDDDEPKTVGFIGTGDGFGELGLMYGTPRAATIIARTEVVCWVLDREAYRGILLNVTMKKREQYMDFLDKIPILKSVEPYEKARIADVLEPVEFPPNTTVFQEGTEGDCFYFIEAGRVQVSTESGGNICVLGPGDYFGELALLFSQPRKATVSTLEHTHLVCLNRKNFTNYLGPVESILKRNTENYSKYLDQAVDAGKKTVDPTLL